MDDVAAKLAALLSVETVLTKCKMHEPLQAPDLFGHADSTLSER
jgi:hypothetical protein